MQVDEPAIWFFDTDNVCEVYKNKFNLLDILYTLVIHLTNICYLSL